MTEDKTVAEAAAANPEPATPMLRVVDPDATPEQIAAIVAVFSALGGGAPAPEQPRSEWAAPARRMRGTHVHYRGAWQASARGTR